MPKAPIQIQTMAIEVRFGEKRRWNQIGNRTAINLSTDMVVRVKIEAQTDIHIKVEVWTILQYTLAALVSGYISTFESGMMKMDVRKSAMAKAPIKMSVAQRRRPGQKMTSITNKFPRTPTMARTNWITSHHSQTKGSHTHSSFLELFCQSLSIVLPSLVAFESCVGERPGGGCDEVI